jgi:hypothetical protein
MAYWKIDETGCGISRGRAKIRISFYLEPTDEGYEKHHVYTVDTDSPEYKQGYPGELDKMGQPVDEVAYKVWLDGLPHRWQNNPFHNHFIYLDEARDISNIKTEIEDMKAEFLNLWRNNKKIAEYWRGMVSIRKFPIPARNYSADESKILKKVSDVIEATKLMRLTL